MSLPVTGVTAIGVGVWTMPMLMFAFSSTAWATHRCDTVLHFKLYIVGSFNRDAILYFDFGSGSCGISDHGLSSLDVD
jgi:hypothetical protein